MYYDIKVALWDMDNTIADFYVYHSRAHMAMFEKLAELSKKDINQIITEAREIYEREGTLEYTPLIQNLPCLKNHPQLDFLVKEGKKAHSTTKRQHLSTYDQIPEILDQLRQRGIKNIILTDAPIIQAAKRVIRLKIDSLINGIIGLKSPSAEEIHPLFRKPNLEFNFPTIVSDFEKPYTKLTETLFCLDETMDSFEQISRHCVMIGDNHEKDIGLAARNGLDALHCQYSKPEQEDIERLLTYAPTGSARRSTQIGSKPVSIHPPIPHQHFEDINHPSEIIAWFKKRHFQVKRDFS